MLLAPLLKFLTSNVKFFKSVLYREIQSASCMFAILFGTNIAVDGFGVDIMSPSKGNLTGVDIQKRAAAAGFPRRNTQRACVGIYPLITRPCGAILLAQLLHTRKFWTVSNISKSY